MLLVLVSLAVQLLLLTSLAAVAVRIPVTLAYLGRTTLAYLAKLLPLTKLT